MADPATRLTTAADLLGLMKRRTTSLCFSIAVVTGACDKQQTPADAPTGAGQGPRARPGGEGSVTPVPEHEPAQPVPEPSDESGQARARTPLVDQSHRLFDRLEGAGFDNACDSDATCKVGGCSSEICSAAEGVNSTCEVLPVQLPEDARCGCLSGQCQWWSPSGAALKKPGPATTPPAANDGTAASDDLVRCGNETCKPGQVCTEYFGIAGPSGPRFQSCEWSCDDGCPKGTQCVTVADGPGRVCR